MLLDKGRIRAFWALILGLFVMSGAAALIYEVVWFQLLRLTIGASAISLGIILATFMGGLCLGSLFYHRFVEDHVHPLKAYGILEIGIGVFGVLNPLLIPSIGELYFSFSGYGYADIILRGCLAALFLLPPTVLMGATLPAISRWIAHSREGAASLGFFYAANIVGAVIGCTLAGFFLLRVFDVYVTSAVAVAANLIGGAVALAIARSAPSRVHEPAEDETEAVSSIDTATDAGQVIRTRVLWLIGLSGLTALGAQVVWTRLLSLYFGGTVYTFSVILAVFLVGLGLGSMAGTKLAHTGRRLVLILGATQLLLVPAIWWAQFAIQDIIHNLFFFGIQPGSVVQTSNWIAKSFNDIVVAAVVLAPATILWGASFPLALVLASGAGRDPGHFTGQVYAANTLGAVVGALAWSMVFVPFVGTRSAQQALMIFALFAVAMLWMPRAIKQQSEQAGSPHFATVFGVVLAAVGLVVLLPASNTDLMAYGRLQKNWGKAEYVEIGEGVNSTVIVSRGTMKVISRGKVKTVGDWKQLHVAGKVVASSQPPDMRLQRQLGHLPALVHENPKSALIIGFGAGVTSGVFTRYPSIERIVIVEIEPEVLRLSSKHFREENYDVVNDPRTKIYIDDGRHYLATTDEKFDIITTDPIHPWMKGAASLYTSEFYELVKERLNPGGVITQWVPLYESDESSVKSQVATFLEAFPDGSIWNSQASLVGYDLTLLGHVDPVKINDEKILARVNGNPSVGKSLVDVGIKQLGDVLKLYSGNRSDVSDWLADAQLNRDRNLRLEYLAGTALNVQIATQIYRNMIDGITYPSELFDISSQREIILRRYFRKLNAAAELTREQHQAKRAQRQEGVD